MRFLFALLGTTGLVCAQELFPDLPYVDPAHERQVLDIYAPKQAENLPVVFWIHGGGWQTGDKSDVQIKPQVFGERGFVFVSTNYRLYPEVSMEELIGDVASSLGWVYQNISRYGGDQSRLFVMGHSAGAQLAALLCCDERYLGAEGVPFSALRGCVPVDGDTYDLPAIIMTAELRQTLHGLPLPRTGHRVKFGNDPAKHRDFSAVSHIAPDKGIPPFLVLYFTGNPNTRAQAQRLGAVLKDASIPVKLVGKRDTNHSRLSQDLGKPDDSATEELFRFVTPLMQP